MRRLVFSRFIDHFSLSETRIIKPDMARFKPLREIKAEGIRMSAIYFESGVERLDLQLECAAGFCTLMFSEDPLPKTNLPRHVACRLQDGGQPLYMLTDFWDHIEFGKRFLLEVLDV